MHFSLFNNRFEIVEESSGCNSSFLVKYEIVGEDSECNDGKNLLFIVT